LKMIRDRAILNFTKDPEARFERLLLYADKRVGAAEVLIKGNKSELGLTTATKAEKYLTQAVNQFVKLAESGQARPEMKNKLTKAILKHEEVLQGVLNNLSDQSRGTLDKTIGNIAQNLEKLKS